MLKGKNNAFGALYESISSSDTTCKIIKPNTFTQGTPIEVPFIMTIYERSLSDAMINFEIVRVTNVEVGLNYDTFTIVRAQEKTEELTHDAGKRCGNLLTRGYFDDKFNYTIEVEGDQPYLVWEV